MNDFDTFKTELSNTLPHLFNPNYQPTALLYTVIGGVSRVEPNEVQAELLKAIEQLKPSGNAPPGLLRQRAYDILHHRFTLRLSQEEAADALHLSKRTLQRAQQEAIHGLALMLWQAHLNGPLVASENDAPMPDEIFTDVITRDWHMQAEQEMAALNAGAPNSVTDVPDMLQGLLALEHALTKSPDIYINVRYAQPNLVAAVHPSALRQTLIASVGRLAQQVSSGEIAIYAGLENADVKITLSALVERESGKTYVDCTHDIVVPAGGSVEADCDGDRLFLNVRVPSTGEVTVLAVDDNQDMVHFYRRCTSGTRYRIIQASTGNEALERIRIQPPDVILLDVMLPDIDGWNLLMQLHEDLETRRIPVVVCTVVREEALAYSLGATHFLSKPILPQQLVQVLDQVLLQASEAAPRTA